MKRVIIAATAVLLLGLGESVWAEEPRQDLAALEEKLHGAWDGQGPCDGGLLLRADGTYERTRFGPAGSNATGTWELRWDALPPTLVLTYATFDDPDYVGTTYEVKLIQLDDENLVLRYASQASSRYKRAPE